MMENENNTETTAKQSENQGEDNSPNFEAPQEVKQQSSEPENEISTQELENVVSILQQEIVILKQKLDEQTEKVDSFKNQYSRTIADFDNFRKRTQKEKEELEVKAKKNVILELLPVVDNFERARTQIKPGSEGEIAIQKSYQGVYKNLADTLKRLGVSRMRPEGQPFDPTYHEALLREPTDKYPEGVVIEQLQEGYLLGEEVIRHARVKVAAPNEATEDELESP